MRPRPMTRGHLLWPVTRDARPTRRGEAHGGLDDGPARAALGIPREPPGQELPPSGAALLARSAPSEAAAGKVLEIDTVPSKRRALQILRSQQVGPLRRGRRRGRWPARLRPDSRASLAGGQGGRRQRPRSCPCSPHASSSRPLEEPRVRSSPQAVRDSGLPHRGRRGAGHGPALCRVGLVNSRGSGRKTTLGVPSLVLTPVPPSRATLPDPSLL